MTTLRIILGDQLSRAIPTLATLAPGDTILLAEVMGECTYVPHHPRKITLVLSAMRHFAAALAARGATVRYVKLNDPQNTQSITGEMARAAKSLHPEKIIVTEPGEWRLKQDMLDWQHITGIPTEILEDTRFLATRADFESWARGKTTLRMEFFYREMRRRHAILMNGDAPESGRWNFDSENRKKLPKHIKPPTPKSFPPDAITTEIIALVRETFPTHYGSLDNFDSPVTARDAEAAFTDFLNHRLPSFGDWQDAMAQDEPTMFHALVSAPLNLGLLDPLKLCRQAEQRYRAGAAPLPAVEGFIRQILGWREFVRGIYWRHMPDYAGLNILDATRDLPEFYWTGETNMRCMAAAIGQTMRTAYAHHIQRLMITGNFALLAGLHPDQVDQWYLAVYADAYEWVEMPNTRGMALHADGGIVGSKPYAASGAYINRMSNYCPDCHYKVSESTTDRACPFNALYWDFIARHEQRFPANPRMQMPVASWRKTPPEKQAALRARAAWLLNQLNRKETTI